MNKLKEVTETQQKHEFMDEIKNPESYEREKILKNWNGEGENEVNFEVNFSSSIR